MWNYSKKVKDHFLHPRNVGELENPDAVAEVGNITCGDALRLALKLDAKGRIAEVKFQTFGCASAIASSSALTEMIKGMTLDEAEKVTNEDIARYLDGLPEEKMHCSVMGRDALEAAIANYRRKRGAPGKEDKSPIVCRCFGVTQEQIERAIRENALDSIEEVTHYTKAGGGCRSCHPQIAEILLRMRGEGRGAAEREPRLTRPRMTNIQKISLIQDTIEKEIRPALQKDGGDVELIDVVDNTVFVALRGACAGCPMSSVTIKRAVEEKLREYVLPDLVVEEAQA